MWKKQKDDEKTKTKKVERDEEIQEIDEFIEEDDEEPRKRFNSEVQQIKRAAQTETLPKKVEKSEGERFSFISQPAIEGVVDKDDEHINSSIYALLADILNRLERIERRINE